MTRAGSAPESSTPVPATEPAHQPGRAGGRLLGVDLARAVAIAGMVAVNVGPRDDSGPADLVIRAAHGRASLLFVLLAGVGIGLLVSRTGTGRVAGSLAWRAGVLIVIGLALQPLSHDVSVILPTYAVLFALALGAVRLPRWALIGAASAITVVGPILWILAQQPTEPFDLALAPITAGPVAILTAILLSGPYPVITWLAPFLCGLWLGRCDLASPAVQRRLVVAGLGAAALAVLGSRLLVALTGQPDEQQVGFDRLVSAVAHSQMPLWLISGTGLATAVLGAMLLLAPRARWLRPLIALGQLSLTVYVLHLILLATVIRPGPTTAWAGLAITGAILAVSILLATLWRSRFERGPFEALMHHPFRHRSRTP
ncbi:DUF418 domain-containing protein [Ruania suaedae]|uniref:DUF418 domain-containing protein n=1 Tax=Ruania suaedae TaxID=2897774 RepID=UPI001E404F64|nr:DUF418 domain-containing protein [Ruania suaedae]UFU03003.1 DUF418 domain-containing protein [Ruania suaedae]